MVFWAQEGLEWVRGWIPLHLDKVSAQMDHSGSILGPFLIFDFVPGQNYSDRAPNRAPKGPILLGASPPDPPASAFGLQKVGLRPPWVPVRAGWAQKVGLRPPWVPIRAGWAQNGTPYGFPKNWKSKMDPKWIQNGPFGLKLGPNESESTPGPFPNPPGPQNIHI